MTLTIFLFPILLLQAGTPVIDVKVDADAFRRAGAVDVKSAPEVLNLECGDIELDLKKEGNGFRPMTSDNDVVFSPRVDVVGLVVERPDSPFDNDNNFYRVLRYDSMTKEYIIEQSQDINRQGLPPAVAIPGKFLKHKMYRRCTDKNLKRPKPPVY